MVLPATLRFASYHLKERGLSDSSPSYFICPIPGKNSLLPNMMPIICVFILYCLIRPRHDCCPGKRIFLFDVFSCSYEKFLLLFACPACQNIKLPRSPRCR